MGEFFDSSWIGPLRRKFVISRAPQNGNAVAITFDDGPHPVHTPELLALLEAENAVATFFLGGIEIEVCPHLAGEIAARGHEIGNHSYSHGIMAVIGFARYADDVEKTSRLIEKYAHRLPVLFRPPYGERGFRLLWLMFSRRLKCVIWSVDHHDYLVRDPGVLIRLLRNTPLVGGDILLFHETNPATIAAMPAIIRDIRSRGFALSTVSDLLRKPSRRQDLPPVPRPEKIGGMAGWRAENAIGK